MIKKTLFLGSLFASLMVVNLYVSTKVYFSRLRQSSTAKVIKELDDQVNLNRQFTRSSSPLVWNKMSAKIETEDGRVANLKNFFRKHNSPLFEYADHIVAVSDKYNFDYRLLPAIAMQESNLCKKSPVNSYNCWGWGIYGTKITRFKSYDDAINVVGLGIKKHYIDKGLVSIRAIMQKYTPSSNGSWARGVGFFFLSLK